MNGLQTGTGSVSPHLGTHLSCARVCPLSYTAQVASWLKGHVSSKYPLVAQTTQQASEAAVDRLQVMLPGLLPLGTAAVGELGPAAVAACKSCWLRGLTLCRSVHGQVQETAAHPCLTA